MPLPVPTRFSHCTDFLFFSFPVYSEKTSFWHSPERLTTPLLRQKYVRDPFILFTAMFNHYVPVSASFINFFYSTAQFIPFGVSVKPLPSPDLWFPLIHLFWRSSASSVTRLQIASVVPIFYSFSPSLKHFTSRMLFMIAIQPKIFSFARSLHDKMAISTISSRVLLFYTCYSYFRFLRILFNRKKIGFQRTFYCVFSLCCSGFLTGAVPMFLCLASTV